MSLEGRHIDRRTFLRSAAGAAGAVALPGALAACGSSKGTGASTASAAGPKITSKTVVFPFYGGDFGKAQTSVMFDSFTKRHGVRVLTPTADVAKFLAMAKSGRASQWDSIDSDGYTAVEWAQQGILQKLPSWVQRCDLVDKRWQDYCGGGYAYNLSQGYLSATFPDGGPTSWADFWDVKRFPGKRAWPTFFPGVIEAALMADGVAPDALYPLDIQRGLSKLDEVRSHLQFCESYGQGAQLLGAKSVSIAYIPASRTAALSKQGLDAKIVWDQAVLFPWSCAPVVRNAPHSDAMFALVDWMSDPRRQAQLAKETLNAPTNSKAFEFLDETTTASLVNSPEHRKVAAIVDNDAMAREYQDVSDQYTTWLAKK
jgi:putative spermidine/putrescine transport system substrate-binding protein